MSFVSSGQNPLAGTVFNEVELRVDTAVYRFSSDKITFGGEQYLPFFYSRNDQLVDVRFYLRSNLQPGIKSISLARSEDFSLIDSLTLINGSYYHARIRFNDATRSEFPVLGLDVNVQDARRVVIPLYPYTKTYAALYPGDSELYTGEEKRFEVVTNNVSNLDLDFRWQKGTGYEYRYFLENEKLYLSVLPLTVGRIEVDLTMKLRKPNMVDGKPIFQLSPQKVEFFIRGSRLSFLRFDTREVVWIRDQRDGIEIQLESHRLLQMNTTYRIEDTDELGGPLIAEIHTIRRLSNDRILCSFRPYHYHDQSEGYLYIKDGDAPLFITNVNIIPEPAIERVSILRKGGSWVESNVLYPGETVEVRLEGKSLSRASLIFEDLIRMEADSVLRNDKVANYILRVPVNIRKKSVSVYNGKKNTGITFNILEHQRPREFDFIVLEYGGTPKRVNEITQPILKNGTIGNVNIRFDGFLIDEPDMLYGKQYIELEIRILDSRNILREKQVVDNLVICPGDGSPRFFAYMGENGCMNEAVSLNDVLTNKTHALDNWSKIELIFRHRKDFHGGRGYTERVEIIKEKLVTFDVDLSIPAGLLIKKVDVDGFPGLSGISLSMLAQFSFYQKGEIQRLRPYKIGAGFLAQNAFNFNPDADRDLGIVILGSVYPTRKERRLSFPLYAGFGYFLNQDKFFYLIGPGIRVNF